MKGFNKESKLGVWKRNYLFKIFPEDHGLFIRGKGH